MTERRRQPLRTLLFALSSLLVSFLLIEAGLRIVFAVRVGPSVLLYGTSANRDVRYFDEPRERAKHQSMKALAAMKRHEQEEDSAWTADLHLPSYAKYHPNQSRVDFDRRTGQRFDVSINRHGFRGADFERQKRPGVVRVVTLGASSTFGYYSRDHETYPVVLEGLLNELCPGRTYEVVNLGIPHLTTSQILALYRAEGAPLGADVVTFYEGVNDTLRIELGEKEPGFAKDLVSALRTRVVLVALLDAMLDLRGISVDPDALRRAAEPVAADFIANLKALRTSVEADGGRFVVVSQQAKSSTIARERVGHMTYADERDEIWTRLERDRPELRRNEMHFLVHGELMDAERAWVAAEDVPFVDGIASLDSDRDVLLSWVHLSPRGNRILAGAIAPKIVELTCSAAR